MGKPLFMVLLVVFLVGTVHAQEDKSGKVVKVNLNYVQSFNQSRSFTIGNVAPALVLYDKRKHSHELELNSIAIRKEESIRYEDRDTLIEVGGQIKRYPKSVQVGGSVIHSSVIRLRYQYSFRFLKSRKYSPYLGISPLLGYEKIDRQPYVLEEYKSTVWNPFRRKSVMYNVNVGVVPGIQCRLGKRMVAEMSIPVDFLDLGTQVQRVYNPTLPRRQQEQWLPEVQLYRPAQLHLRAGVGIKI
jgi:hypothetical protein